MLRKNKICFTFTILIFMSFTSSVAMGQKNKNNEPLNVGDLKVYKLQDGQTYLQVSDLLGINHDEAKKLVGGLDSVCVPINSYLIKTPNRALLVDAGAGINIGEDTGHLIEQLKEVGIEPNQIDIILITHFHFDHIGGLTTPEGNPVFPNATLYISKVESDYWMRDLDSIPENQRIRASKYKVILSPYVSTNRYRTFLPNDDLGDGIKALPSYGHTIGHTVYTTLSKGEEIWFIGDLLHFEKIQFKYPRVSVSFDYNAQMAIDSRLNYFKRAAKANAYVAGTHLTKIVKLKTDKKGFKSMPVNTY